MASGGFQKLDEKLGCCICLELFTIPVTVPCGHTFCDKCIKSHWDKEEEGEGHPGARKVYTCPECRQGFPERPELNKTVQLHHIVELVKAGEVQATTPAGKVAPGTGKVCPRHGRPLELYCRTEARAICCECSVRECQGHTVLLVEDEWKIKEETLKETLRETQKAAEKLKEESQRTEEQITSIKDSSEKFKSGLLQKFGHLMEALKECQMRAVERIEHKQAQALGQMGENWNCLQYQLNAFTQHNEKVEELLACTDNITFLEKLHQLPSPGKLEILPVVEFSPASSEDALVQTLSDVVKLLQGTLLNSSIPGAETASPEPKLTVKKGRPSLPLNQLRKSLLKDQQNLTFDSSTANKYLRFSDQDRKATHPQGSSTLPNVPQRFESWQVMCLQKFNRGRNYWEVKLSGYSAIVGLAYEGMSRKKRAGRTFTIGQDQFSWGLHVQRDCYVAWYNGMSIKINKPLCNFIGVVLDYEQGVLSFYGIDENMELLHSFNSIFTKPLIPIFWLCERATVTLCQEPHAPVVTDRVTPGLQGAPVAVEKPNEEQIDPKN